MSYRGPFNRDQDNPSGPYRGRGRGFGRGRGRGGSTFGTDFNPSPLEQNPSTVPPTGVYQHPHANRARGRGSWGRGGQNSWSVPNSSGASGASSPRGYPPRNKFSQSSQPSAPRGGGLGFHANTSNRPPVNFPRSVAEPPRTPRGTSDPRLLIPIKFVKATELTDKAVENIPKEKLRDGPNEPGAQQKSESQVKPPLAAEARPVPAPPSPSDRLLEIEEVTPASLEQFQTDFPGIFHNKCSITAFQSATSAVQGRDASLPSQPSQAAISSQGDPISPPVGVVPDKASQSVSKVPSDSVIPATKSAVASDPVSPAGAGPAESGALFFIDAEGDPNNKPSTSSMPVSNLHGLINKETDEEEERIVFQPDPSATSESHTGESHLFRTITDEVPVKSLVSDAHTGSDSNPSQSKSLMSKPSKQAIKARKRDARKERRKSAQGGQPDSTVDRPGSIESGSDIDCGDDSVQEPVMTPGLGEKALQALSIKAQKRALKDKEDLELCEDYIKHAMMAEAASGDEPDDPSSTTKFLNDPFTKTFMDGMAAQKKHTTIDELDKDDQDDIDDKSLDEPPRWGSPESEPPEEPFDHLYMTDTEEESTASESSDDEEDSETQNSLDKTLETSIELSTESSDVSESEEGPLAMVEGGLDEKEKLKQTKRANDKDQDSELIDFIDDLQKKWRMDRAKKAERKKARAEARRQSSPKTKKQWKKAEKRQDDTPPPDMATLHDRIRQFICFDTDEKTLTLPPVDKKSRAAIHEIANLYRMKSQSYGSGRRRHPVLTRTERTTHILKSRAPLFEILNQFTNQGGRNAAVRSMAMVPRNREGAIVGQGVKHIGAENVGFKLLTKMGWSLGETMGDPKNSNAALNKPLVAVMKNTKGGLGLSSFSRHFHD